MIGGEADGNDARPIHTRRGDTSAPGYRGAAAALPRARGRFQTCAGEAGHYSAALARALDAANALTVISPRDYSRLGYMCPVSFWPLGDFTKEAMRRSSHRRQTVDARRENFPRSGERGCNSMQLVVERESLCSAARPRQAEHGQKARGTRRIELQSC